MFQNIILAWTWRRLQEVGGWAAVVVPLYMAMPPAQQAVVNEILQGRGGGLSISAALGLAVYLFSQFQSFRSTTKPQVVTADAKQIPLKKGTAALDQIETKAATAPKPKTFWERITNK